MAMTEKDYASGLLNFRINRVYRLRLLLISQ